MKAQGYRHDASTGFPPAKIRYLSLCLRDRQIAGQWLAPGGRSGRARRGAARAASARADRIGRGGGFGKRTLGHPASLARHGGRSKAYYGSGSEMRVPSPRGRRCSRPRTCRRRSSPSSMRRPWKRWADEASRSRLADLGYEVYSRERQNPEALGALRKADAENGGR